MNFYVLELRGEWSPRKTADSPTHSLWSTAWEVDRMSGDSEKCPLCGRHVSMLSWKEPRKMRLTGKKYPDRLVDCLTEPLVVSDRFVKMYRDEGLSGISGFAPIQVTNHGFGMPNYYLGHISFNRSIEVDLAQTVIEGQLKEWSCPLCNPWGMSKDKIHKLVLLTEKWDGQDIMRLYCFGIIVSQRFYDCVHQYGLTNFVMTEVGQYKFGV